MKYKIPDDGNDHTPTYTRGVDSSLWHKKHDSDPFELEDELDLDELEDIE